MNYRHPLQRKDDGKWQFTCTNGASSWPEGYCGTNDCRHETAEDAAACYRKWMVEQKAGEARPIDVQRKCVLCGEWTARVIMVNGQTYPGYCAKHTLREAAEHAVKDFYSETSSW